MTPEERIAGAISVLEDRTSGLTAMQAILCALDWLKRRDPPAESSVAAQDGSGSTIVMGPVVLQSLPPRIDPGPLENAKPGYVPPDHI